MRVRSNCSRVRCLDGYADRLAHAFIPPAAVPVWQHIISRFIGPITLMDANYFFLSVLYRSRMYNAYVYVCACIYIQMWPNSSLDGGRRWMADLRHLHVGHFKMLFRNRSRQCNDAIVHDGGVCTIQYVRILLYPYVINGLRKRMRTGI